MVVKTQEFLINGMPISRGIAIGYPFFLRNTELIPLDTFINPTHVDGEVLRYKKAILGACEEMKTLQKKLQLEQIFEGAAIVDAHLQMMQDPVFNSSVEIEIRRTHKNAELALCYIINEYQKKFEKIVDPFFRERFKDFQELSRRVISYLRHHERMSEVDIPQEAIVFAQNLTAFDIAEANILCCGAFVTKNGGETSHAAIVAKAKGIPFVSNVDLESIKNIQDYYVIVDGRTGEIIVNPSLETLEKYKQLRHQLNNHLQNLKSKGQLKAETYDGYQVRLSVNVETLAELDIMHQYEGDGVGLLRTELGFLSHEKFPNEQEQLTLYRQFVENMNGLPIVIRTFDLGGDKYLRNQQIEPEGNPFLGCRAIRFSLREKTFFKTQLRAILRASAYGTIKIMFPMISGLSELIEAKKILNETKDELITEGYVIAPNILVGCMIEVPSAAIIVDLLAKECDFLSIGTNDLVQYALAVDRSNQNLSDLYAATHPGILRLIHLVVQEAKVQGIPVTICGELAADPRFTPLLLGLGVNELSVTPRCLPIIKNTIRHTSIVNAVALTEKAMKLSSSDEIELLFTEEYCKNFPDDYFYNC